MKETGIIMSGNHPKLILDGIKTMTRRTSGLYDVNMVGLDGAGQPTSPDQYRFLDFTNGVASFVRHAATIDGIKVGVVYHCKCPYGQVGDRLWVREAYRFDAYYNNRPPRDVPEGVTVECFTSPDAVHTEGNGHRKLTLDPGKWRPSIFMPRWASRITLEITEVRVERLQEITEVDCYKEGLDLSIGMMLVEPHWMTKDILRRKFKGLWDSLNAKRGHGWDKNEWVWPISFKKI